MEDEFIGEMAAVVVVAQKSSFAKPYVYKSIGEVRFHFICLARRWNYLDS
jgi:hypothetical protein